MENIKFWIFPVVIMLALNLWSLKWYPPVGMDDRFVSANAHNFLNKGQFSQPMNRVITVWNESDLWYGLGERNNLLSTISIIWALDYERYFGDDKSCISDLIHQEKVRYLVIEPYLRDYLLQRDTNSKRLFLSFLQTKCRVVKAFRNVGYSGIGESPEGSLTDIYEVIACQQG
jgi:hypothetical protein